MTTKLCYNCDKYFTPRRTSQKFCSDDCRKEFHRESLIKQRSLEDIQDICRCCGKEFNPLRLGHEFCSKECYFRFRYEQNKELNDIVKKECKFCSKVFETNLNEKIYCSKSCGDAMYRSLNKSKIAHQKRDWREENIGRLLEEGKVIRKTKSWKDSHRDWCYKRLYNISLKQYNIIFDSQNGCCAICETHQKDLKKKLFVDHDHSDGSVRGLLCHKCNSALGLFNDDVSLLRSAIKYLGGNC